LYYAMWRQQIGEKYSTSDIKDAIHSN